MDKMDPFNYNPHLIPIENSLKYKISTYKTGPGGSSLFITHTHVHASS